MTQRGIGELNATAARMGFHKGSRRQPEVDNRNVVIRSQTWIKARQGFAMQLYSVRRNKSEDSHEKEGIYGVEGLERAS